MSALPVIHVKGTHYQVGYQIGSAMRHYISEYVSTLPLLNSVLLPYSNTPAGQAAYIHTETLLRQLLPQYVEEVEGLAAGAKQDFKAVFLLNLNCPKGVSEKGCSTVMIPREGKGPLLGHNEDGPPESRGRIFMVHVDIPPTVNTEGESFSALCYPGSLPGRCFGFTKSGFVWSMNSTSPRMERSGIPIQFLSRTLAGQGPTGLSKLLQVLGNGGSLNMADVKTALNFEVAPFRNDIEMMNDTQPLFHCNMYTHLAVKQKLDIHYESSVARLARMGEGRMETEEDMKRCLGDRNGDLPIFRTEDRERDVLVTVATGIFDLFEGRLDVYVSNPAHNGPIYSCNFQPQSVLQNWDMVMSKSQ